MLTESERAPMGSAADIGNRSPGQPEPVTLQVLGVRPVSVPATNRRTPSSWVTEKVSATVSVKLNRNTVACANPPKLSGLVRHAAEIQVAGVGEAGELEAKKPGIVLADVSL